MMRTICFVVAVMGAVFGLTGQVRAAGTLDEVFEKVEGGGWGLGRDAVRQAAGIVLLENDDIIVGSTRLGGKPATINFLFDKSGRLYNMSWLVTTPVLEVKSARRFNLDAVKQIQARYGKPSYKFTDGDHSQSKTAAKKAKDLEEVRKKLIALRESKGGEEPILEEMNAAMGIGKSKTIFDVMPTIFYSKLDFWDGKAIWAYTNLLCSTDGTCYQHIQFVSKHLTAGEQYQPTPDKPFSYSPLDRDQDLVTKSYRSLPLQVDL